ncbi:GNAT family N-acetyltransferase [Subsaxibacter sp. CAU 1640]|uniref:GNAT family N-acetyltransferase n=1 Tax=Subsaxibacter sp. CAU 1640 TaxID=2933271 RepID=UPI002005C931|nr:GNAT family N-acetyltransferase [Subsaxibacter sp. CAU 1640]MCK7589114.1 GNAT family N-acetyltransferase [Subsaxibacter sp. CAU 1640]
MIEISTDKAKLQVELIHQFLATTYWAKGRTLEEVQKTIDHCLCFGIYIDDKQIGFARVATDYTVFAYLMDVFVLPQFRGKGYSKLLMEAVHMEPKLQSCKVWMLKTSDAHGLYEQFGYTQVKNPERLMERLL